MDARKAHAEKVREKLGDQTASNAADQLAEIHRQHLKATKELREMIAEKLKVRSADGVVPLSQPVPNRGLGHLIMLGRICHSIFLSRCSSDHEPWADGPEQENIRRRFIEERYHLLPYLYTTAQQNTTSGLPIVRPLFLEFPDALPDMHPADIDPPTVNEFLFGPDLLVAPPPVLKQTFPIQSTSLVKAGMTTGPGSWSTARGYPLYAPGLQPESGNVAHVTAITVAPTLAELPIYVRPGSILPYAPLTQSTTEIPKGPLTLRVYPGPDCHGSIYTDDGHTFAFRDGAFLQMDFSCERKSDGSISIQIGQHKGGYPAWWTQLSVLPYGMGQAKPSVEWNSHTINSGQRDNAVTFEVPDDGKGLSLNIR